MRYISPSKRLQIHEIIFKINDKKLVTLSERILLSKYLDKFPYLNSLFKKESPKFPQ